MQEIEGDIYQLTRVGLESGLRIGHIASFPIVSCDVADECDAIFNNQAYLDFDHIPVAHDGRVVGALERSRLDQGKSAADCMHPLDDSMLVTADMPLASFLEIIEQATYRLVVRGNKIDGIVTRSDLHKLPVRLFAFAIITHLEMTMSEAIQADFGESNKWLGLVSESRQTNIIKRQEALGKGRLNLSLLECTEFCDKRTILKKHRTLGGQFERELADIEKLRDTLAHAGTYAETTQAVVQFIQRLRNAETWIARLKLPGVR